jgi:hypothetical protein
MAHDLIWIQKSKYFLRLSHLFFKKQSDEFLGPKVAWSSWRRKTRYWILHQFLKEGSHSNSKKGWKSQKGDLTKHISSVHEGEKPDIEYVTSVHEGSHSNDEGSHSNVKFVAKFWNDSTQNSWIHVSEMVQKY